MPLLFRSGLEYIGAAIDPEFIIQIEGKLRTFEDNGTQVSADQAGGKGISEFKGMTQGRNAPMGAEDLVTNGARDTL